MSDLTFQNCDKDGAFDGLAFLSSPQCADVLLGITFAKPSGMNRRPGIFKSITIFGCILLLASCSISPQPAGMNCTEDRDCDTGLACFFGQGVSSGGCLLPTVAQCSKACKNDADCAGMPVPKGKTQVNCVSDCGRGDAGRAQYCQFY